LTLFLKPQLKEKCFMLLITLKQLTKNISIECLKNLQMQLMQSIKRCDKYISKAKEPCLVRSIYDAHLKEERISSACENLHNSSALGWKIHSESNIKNGISLKSSWLE
jgi:hypothetical protein